MIALTTEQQHAESDALPPALSGFSPPPNNGKRRRRRFEVFERDDWTCQYCGRDLLADVDSLLSATIDHLQPKSLGGDSSIDNLATACSTCNVLKNNAPAETLQEARALVARRRGIAVETFARDFRKAGRRFLRGQTPETLASAAASQAAAVVSREAAAIAAAVELLQTQSQILVDVVHAATGRAPGSRGVRGFLGRVWRRWLRRMCGGGHRRRRVKRQPAIKSSAGSAVDAGTRQAGNALARQAILTGRIAAGRDRLDWLENQGLARDGRGDQAELPAELPGRLVDQVEASA